MKFDITDGKRYSLFILKNRMS